MSTKVTALRARRQPGGVRAADAGRGRTVSARDYTREQFAKRLAKYGFERDINNPLWPAYRHPDAPGVSFGSIARRDGTLHRRATLAHLIASLLRHTDITVTTDAEGRNVLHRKPQPPSAA